MGKRSRKRASSSAGTTTARSERAAATSGERGAKSPPPAARARPATTRRRARMDEAPKAPWSPFPLVELCILLSIVLIVVGVVTHGSQRGTLLITGFALITISSLELAIREHFAGYRSHTTLLAGAAAILVDVPIYFLTKWRPEFLLVIGIVAFGIAFSTLRQAFQRRAGGLGFRA
jgi:hypothetical protein